MTAATAFCLPAWGSADQVEDHLPLEVDQKDLDWMEVASHHSCHCHCLMALELHHLQKDTEINIYVKVKCSIAGIMDEIGVMEVICSNDIEVISSNGSNRK